MAYNIQLLTNVSIQKKKYFLDANIWLLALTGKTNLNKAEAKYLEFFNSLHVHTLKPRIILTGQLISEIVNRYLRDIGFERYKAQQPEPRDTIQYKSHYRQSEQFKIDYEVICSDIKAFHNSCDLCSDKLGEEIHFKHLLKDIPKGMDFNDHYACLLAKIHGFTIITHDVDFFIDGIEIITYNQKLYEKMKNTIMPTLGNNVV